MRTSGCPALLRRRWPAVPPPEELPDTAAVCPAVGGPAEPLVPEEAEAEAEEEAEVEEEEREEDVEEAVLE